MTAPNNAVTLMYQIYRKILPMVNAELMKWREMANNIPNNELRKQALASIDNKDFHCEGGAILSLIAEKHQKDCLTFIVAYQTISDYLDNLCDRSTSLDPEDFAALHESLKHALMPEATPTNYYRFRKDQDDGGYLQSLVTTCQKQLQKTLHYDKTKNTLIQLAEYYCDLQVHKHVCISERENRLINWFDTHKANLSHLAWYEFSACAGSTLGIFSLVAYAFRQDLSQSQIERIEHGYFPYTQGLHILLDYFIDQEEDKSGGDLNFCQYYPSEEQMMERLCYFIDESRQSITEMPNARFHQMINLGLLGMYLSDQKAQSDVKMKKLAKQLVDHAGFTAKFFYFNVKTYRLLKSFSKSTIKTAS